jgi:AraC family transcriptional regulator
MSVILKPRSLRSSANRAPDALGRSSFIIQGDKPQHHWQGVGCLSIKSFQGGEAIYNVGAGRYRVPPDSYLVLNQNQPYEITVDVNTPFQSFCLFFEDGFVEDVHRSLTVPTHGLLDNPEDASFSPIYFFERTYRHDKLMSPDLFALKDALPKRRDDELWINQRLHRILERLLEVHRGLQDEIQSLPALRASTREELYRRLYRARDFIAASFDQPLTLDDIARVACLSTNHFLRTFQQLFRQTPHQFLTEQRLLRAQLLLITDLPVTEICATVGFESLGSFSSLFRRKLGVSPIEFRRANDKAPN